MSTAPVAAALSTAGMACEWAANPAACGQACADALSMFSIDVVRIVVKLLKNPDARVFGPKEIQAAYSKEAVEAQIGGPVHELPMPLAFEALLQKDLADVFRPEDCAYWKGKKKVSEVFSVYFKPQNLSPAKIEALAKGRGANFFEDRDVEDASESEASLITNEIDPAASWIFFPDDPLPVGSDWEVPVRAQDFRDRQALLPKDCQVPIVGDAGYCIFTRFACTEERIFPLAPPIGINTLEKIYVGMFSEAGLIVWPNWKNRSTYTNIGIAPMWKASKILVAKGGA